MVPPAGVPWVCAVVSRAVWHVAGGVGHGEQRKRALCGAGKLRRRHAEQLLPLGLRQYPAVLCRGGGAVPRHRLPAGEHDFLAFTSADFVADARAAHPDFSAHSGDCPPLEGDDGRQFVADAHAETPRRGLEVHHPADPLPVEEHRRGQSPVPHRLAGD